MNLNQLEYFINVAESLNFTKAAEKCYISQTAMTQQIKALENTIGVPLFVRDKHHVELTAAGNVFLKEARAILERSNTALRLTRNVASGVTGKITIGFINGYGHDEFIEVIRNFHNTFPNIQISFIRNNSSVLFEKLEKNECDIIFTISPYRQIYANMEHMYLTSYPLYATLYTGHPFINKESLTYTDLKEEDFIIMQPTKRAKDEAEESMLVYDRGGFFPNVIASEGEVETLLSMISIGLGISILPEYIIRPYLNKQDIKSLPLLKEDGSAETLDFELSWPKQNTNPAVNQLIEIIKTYTR